MSSTTTGAGEDNSISKSFSTLLESLKKPRGPPVKTNAVPPTTVTKYIIKTVAGDVDFSMPHPDRVYPAVGDSHLVAKRPIVITVNGFSRPAKPDERAYVCIHELKRSTELGLPKPEFYFESRTNLKELKASTINQMMEEIIALGFYNKAMINNIMKYYVENDMESRALEMWQRIAKMMPGFYPRSLMKHRLEKGDLTAIEEATKMGAKDHSVSMTIASHHAKKGNKEAFIKTANHSVSLARGIDYYHVLIAQYAKEGSTRDADIIELLDQMRREGLRHDNITFRPLIPLLHSGNATPPLEARIVEALSAKPRVAFPHTRADYERLGMYAVRRKRWGFLERILEDHDKVYQQKMKIYYYNMLLQQMSASGNVQGMNKCLNELFEAKHINIQTINIFLETLAHDGEYARIEELTNPKNLRRLKLSPTFDTNILLAKVLIHKRDVNLLSTLLLRLLHQPNSHLFTSIHRILITQQQQSTDSFNPVEYYRSDNPVSTDDNAKAWLASLLKSSTLPTDQRLAYIAGLVEPLFIQQNQPSVGQ
eukprot:gene14167-16699_t